MKVTIEMVEYWVGLENPNDIILEIANSIFYEDEHEENEYKFGLEKSRARNYLTDWITSKKRIYTDRGKNEKS